MSIGVYALIVVPPLFLILSPHHLVVVATMFFGLTVETVVTQVLFGEKKS